MAFGHAQVEVKRDEKNNVVEVQVVGRDKPGDEGTVVFSAPVANGSQEDLKYALDTANDEAVKASKW